MTDKDLLISWLRDAHAMETALVPVLEQHARDARENEEISSRISLHAEQTRRHAELVRGCLERLDTKESSLKSGMSGAMGWLQGASTKMFSDEQVKNALSDYSTEHFELACYRALEQAADQVGEREIAETCRAIQEDEREMAQFLEQHLAVVIRTAMARAPQR